MTPAQRARLREIADRVLRQTDNADPDCGLYDVAERPIGGIGDQLFIRDIRDLASAAVITEGAKDTARLLAQVNEALSVLETGSEYEKLHVIGILRAGLPASGVDAAASIKEGE